VMQPEIKQCETTDWPMKAAGLISDSIKSVLAEQGKCSVMLTGGRSAERLYKAWRDLPAFQKMTGVSFYFGDERCVPPDHAESNYGMAKQTLFPHGASTGYSVFRMEADDTDQEAAAQRYADLLPDSIDVLLLGVGEDGHIASLFPNNASLQERKRRVIPITGPKPPFERLTITPQVITKARSVFVLATGSAKAAMLCTALTNPNDIATLPVRLTLGGTWLMDCQPHLKAPCDFF
jgi:6-phosphogluconolactonase